MNDIMTINRFNRLTSQETLHPLVGIADLTADTLERDIDDTCDFFALLCYCGRLRLVLPGEPFRIPAAAHRLKEGYTGVLFHPDLLCGTPLDGRMLDYTCRCNCRKPLCENERKAISGCISQIARELQHSIDRYTSIIIASLGQGVEPIISTILKPSTPRQKPWHIVQASATAKMSAVPSSVIHFAVRKKTICRSSKPSKTIEKSAQKVCRKVSVGHEFIQQWWKK